MRANQIAQVLGLEGLGEVRIGAEREAALFVALGGLRADDDEGRLPEVLALAYEVHQLQPVDVGHVDVGDDEVVRTTREEPEGLEAARRLDDLDGFVAVVGLFQRGANERSHRGGVFHEEDARHLVSVYTRAGWRGEIPMTRGLDVEPDAGLVTWQTTGIANALSSAKTISCGALVAAAAVGLFLPISPAIHVSANTAALITFLGAALASAGAVAVGSRAIRPTATVVLGLDVIALGALVAVALLRPHASAVGVGVDAALVLFACATGGALGSRVQHPGHLLPAGVVAACADVISVVSPSGPTHALAESERALAVTAFHFPVPGTTVIAPVIGVGDLVFLALVLAAASAHALPYGRIVALAFVGLLFAGFASALAKSAMPALPFLIAPVLLFVPAARTLARKDKNVATLAIGVSVALAAVTMARRFL